MSHGRSIAAFVLVACLAGGCNIQPASRGAAASPTPSGPTTAPAPSGPIASDLPSGVCVPTYEQLSNPDATRIEAKLVTREILIQSDPNFAPGSNPAKYFWIVANVGTLTVEAPKPPGAKAPVLHNWLSYRVGSVDPAVPESIASPCRVFELSGGGGAAWPAWFDGMAAVGDIKIR